MKGIVPRMVKTIFELVENADENIEFTVKVSYLEIYMEKIRDLLDPIKNNLPIRENKLKGIYVDGATEVYVSAEEDVMNVIRTGTANRAVCCLYFILFYFILFIFIYLFYFIHYLFYFIYFILFYFILFYLFYFILFYFICLFLFLFF